MNLLFPRTKDYKGYLDTTAFPRNRGFADRIRFRVIPIVTYCLLENLYPVFTDDILGNDDYGKWEDYFEPFVETVEDYNKSKTVTLEKEAGIAYKKYIEQIPESRFLQSSLKKEDYNSQILNSIMVYNGTTRAQIDLAIKELKLQPPYAAIHVRWGDKLTVCEYRTKKFAANEYLNKINIGRLFVMSDDYAFIAELKSSFPEIEVITTAEERHAGNVGANSFGKQFGVARETVRLLVDMECARKSSMFIGTRYSGLSFLIHKLHQFQDRCSTIEGLPFPKDIT
jgi:hypothetical protein